jgi:hypothetical protein
VAGYGKNRRAPVGQSAYWEGRTKIVGYKIRLKDKNLRMPKM